MPKVELADSILSQNCIKSCVVELAKLTLADQQLHIVATEYVKDIDILLIGYFILFKRNYTVQYPQFSICLELKKNTKPALRPDDKKVDFPKHFAAYAQFSENYLQKTGNKIDDGLGSTLRQYMAYAQLQSADNQPFQVKYGYYLNYGHDHSDTDDMNNATDSWLRLSRRFIPVVHVSHESYEQFFMQKTEIKNFKSFVRSIEYDANSEQLYRNCSNSITREIFKIKDRLSKLQYLSRLAFFLIVDKANVLNFYLKPKDYDTTLLQAGNLQDTAAIEFYNAVTPLLAEVSTKPMIFQFVYSVLLSSAMLPSRLTQNNRDVFIQILQQLWRFTQELVYGIQELAKNVLEHSKEEDKIVNGIITARIYDRLLYAEDKIFAPFLSSLDKKGKSALEFFDVNVADDGETGVMATLFRKTRTLAEESGPLQEAYQNDVDLIKEQKVVFRDFLDNSRGIVLGQQVKRATAHLGLIALSQLIGDNSGLLQASTWTSTTSKLLRTNEMVFDNGKGGQPDLIPFGTHFRMIMPVNRSANYQSKFYFEPQMPPVVTPEYIQGMEALFNFERYHYNPKQPLSSQLSVESILTLSLPREDNPSIEYWNLLPFADAASIFETIKTHQTFFCIDLEHSEVDAGRLFRLLGNWELIFPGWPLLISNIRSAAYFKLLSLNSGYLRSTTATKLPFWNLNSLVIFYNYTQYRSRRFYFTDVLWGATMNDFLVLNRLISRTNFNALTIDLSEQGEPANIFVEKKTLEELRPIRQNLSHFGVFKGQYILLPFHLLLKGFDDVTLFESNAAFLLQNQFEIYHSGEDSHAVDNLGRFLAAMPGFQLPHTHFRIGSKVHVSTFYHAKRFFQNSFFSSPLAFLLAREIFKSHLRELAADIRSEKSKKLLDEGITLIGYGRYSELLTGMVQTFLGKIIIEHLADAEAIEKKVTFTDKKKETLMKNLHLSHDLVNEDDEVVRIRNEKVYGNVILIVPIATTFSTAIKIAQEIENAHPQKIVLPPHLSVIYVYDDKVEAKDRLANTFGIINEDFKNGTADVNAFFTLGNSKKKIMQQRFLLHMPSKWYEIASCEHCFPTDTQKKERPLFVTEKSQTNPVLVFGLPNGRQTRPQGGHHSKNQFSLQTTAVKCGHYKRDGNHYHYYVYIEEFFNQNKESIRKWLNGLKTHEEFAELDAETHQVVIIAPGHNSNTGFINLVNEVLFYNSANIIHYEPSNDHIQNFQLFYARDIDSKVTKLIFVDDVLTSGNSFTRTNYFLKHTRKGQRGFEAAIVLMDRSGNFVHDNVKRKLTGRPKKMFSFADFNLPSLKAADHDCPLCLENRRYFDLSKHSFLDRLRQHFLQQAEKTRPLDIESLKLDLYNLNADFQVDAKTNACVVAKRYVDEVSEDASKYLRRINAMHSIFEWFALEENRKAFFEKYKDAGFYDWYKAVRGAYSPFYETLKEPAPEGNKYISDPDVDAFVRVISQTPFDQFKPFRERIFTWLVDFLMLEAAQIETDIDNDGKLDPSAFRRLKFLIRRGGTLGSNFLISDQMFDVLAKVLGEKGINPLITLTEKEIARLKKLIRPKKGQNQQRSTDELALLKQQHLLENLQDFPTFYAAQIKELIHLNEAKSIRLEKLTLARLTSEGIDPLYRQLVRITHAENGVLIQKFLEFVQPILPKKVDETWYYTNSAIITALQPESVRAHYRYSTLKAFLKESGIDEPIGDRALLGYLWLMNYLEKERKISSQTLNNKTELIIRKMVEILFDEHPEAGGFMIVRYERNQSDDYFTAYNFGQSGPMQESHWDEKGYGYLKRFISGARDANNGLVTVSELRKVNKVWIDEYSTKKDNQEPSLHPELLPACYDKLLLMRLNKLSSGVSEKNQLIGHQSDLPLGVIGIYFNSKAEDELHRYRARYLLMLRQALSGFIEHHHESSEFRDWIDANNSSRVALLTGHGREVLLSLTEKDFGPGVDRPYKKIVYTMLIVQRFLIDEQDSSYLQIPSEHIKKIFFNFLNPKGELIKPGYFEDSIKQMGNELFEFPEIENPDKADVTAHAKGISFDFQRDLLDMICFELLVNAKKNRWLFVGGKPFGGLERNAVHVQAKQDGDWLTITITNTGPQVGDNGMNTLKLDNPKPDSSSSGISLIKKLLKVFEIGTLTFKEDESSIFEELNRFHATLHIKKWSKIKISS